MAFTLLTEGMSVRAVSRITGLHKNTVLDLMETVAEKCRKVFDEQIQNVTPRYVQADEIWTFVHTKAKRVKESDPLEYGDAYVWIALDSETKAVLSGEVQGRLKGPVWCQKSPRSDDSAWAHCWQPTSRLAARRTNAGPTDSH